MIKTEVIGHLGKDAGLKNIAGNNYASFSIAVTEKTKGTPKTMWINCLKADKEGKLLPYLKKGTKLFIAGKPVLSVYTNKNAEPIADMTIWVNELEFCGSSQKAEAQPAGTANFPEIQETDDLPF